MGYLLLVGFLVQTILAHISGKNFPEIWLGRVGFGGLAIWILSERTTDWAERGVWQSGLAVVILLLGAEIMRSMPTPPIDVFELHRAVAEAIANGQNPYSDAVLVHDTSPLAPAGATISGATYPPLTLLLYSLGTWFGDPRTTSLASGLVAAMVVAGMTPSNNFRATRARLLVALLLAANPAFAHVVAWAWTEPSSLPFLVLGIAWWRGRPVASAVALGLAFATKQYFALALPILLMIPDDHRWRRAMIAGGVATATLLPFALLDPQALWNALIEFHWSRPARPDSVSIVGLGVQLPKWCGMGIGILVALAAGTRVRTGSEFATALAATVAAFFALSGHAFANQWFLVASLLLVAAAYQPGHTTELNTPMDADRGESTSKKHGTAPDGAMRGET